MQNQSEIFYLHNETSGFKGNDFTILPSISDTERVKFILCDADDAFTRICHNYQDKQLTSTNYINFFDESGSWFYESSGIHIIEVETKKENKFSFTLDVYSYKLASYENLKTMIEVINSSIEHDIYADVGRSYLSNPDINQDERLNRNKIFLAEQLLSSIQKQMPALRRIIGIEHIHAQSNKGKVTQRTIISILERNNNFVTINSSHAITEIKKPTLNQENLLILKFLCFLLQDINSIRNWLQKELDKCHFSIPRNGEETDFKKIKKEEKINRLQNYQIKVDKICLRINTIFSYFHFSNQKNIITQSNIHKEFIHHYTKIKSHIVYKTIFSNILNYLNFSAKNIEANIFNELKSETDLFEYYCLQKIHYSLTDLNFKIQNSENNKIDYINDNFLISLFFRHSINDMKEIGFFHKENKNPAPDYLLLLKNRKTHQQFYLIIDAKFSYNPKQYLFWGKRNNYDENGTDYGCAWVYTHMINHKYAKKLGLVLLGITKEKEQTSYKDSSYEYSIYGEETIFPFNMVHSLEINRFENRGLTKFFSCILDKIS